MSLSEVNPALIKNFDTQNWAERHTRTLFRLIAQAAKHESWSVGTSHFDQIHRTYDWIEISGMPNTNAILCTKSSGCITAATCEESGIPKTYVENSTLKYIVNQYNQPYLPHICILKPDLLLAELTVTDAKWLRAVKPEMTYDLKCWNPQIVGQVIYNYWD